MEQKTCNFLSFDLNVRRQIASCHFIYCSSTVAHWQRACLGSKMLWVRFPGSCNMAYIPPDQVTVLAGFDKREVAHKFLSLSHLFWVSSSGYCYYLLIIFVQSSNKNTFCRDSRVQAQCHIYNKATDAWDPMGSMVEERASYGVVQLTDTAFWIVGKTLIV